MPEFSTSFSGNKFKRILDKQELIRAIRFSIAAEYEAIQLYEQLRDSIECEEAKKLLEEISGDEKTHAGNFLYLLKMLAPDEAEFYENGEKEAKEIIDK